LRATVRVATLNGALALRNADVAIILSVRLCCTPDRWWWTVWREGGLVLEKAEELDFEREVELEIDLRIRQKSSLKLLESADYKPGDWLRSHWWSVQKNLITWS
jgi:hypothetical protein